MIGILTITKLCTHPCPDEFSITVTGNNPQPSSSSLGNEGHQAVTLGPGTFVVTETPVAGFLAPLFAVDCHQTAPRSNSAAGTISAGQNLFCIIINTSTS
jgi:hypothetical protein